MDPFRLWECGRRLTVSGIVWVQAVQDGKFADQGQAHDALDCIRIVNERPELLPTAIKVLCRGGMERGVQVGWRHSKRGHTAVIHYEFPPSGLC